MSNIRKIEPRIPQMPVKKKVAAYCRVSKDTDRLRHSLSVQISHYSSFIQENPKWEYAGVYSDDAITGTRLFKRDGYKEMVEDATKGKIDLILVKSVSRFGRNTVDTLNTTRYLKSIGVEVFFEKENVSSLSPDGELMLTLLASFAQAEVESMSENIKWSRRKCFAKGDPQTRSRLFGYEWIDDELTIVPEEAEIVKSIFVDYLAGGSSVSISRSLNEKGIKTIRNDDFNDEAIIYILKNITYTGNLLLQKTVVVDPLEKKRIRNKGEFEQFYVEDSHEAIIDMDTFNKVQALMESHKSLGGGPRVKANPFSKRIVCGKCGTNYAISRKQGSTDNFYCSAKQQGRERCGNPSISVATLLDKTTYVLGVEELTRKDIEDGIKRIVVNKGLLTYTLSDGQQLEVPWKSRVKYGKEYSHKWEE